MVNPKDLNKDRGLTKMSPLFLFTLLIPEIIVHDVSFTFIRVKQVKYSLFHGRWAAEVPNQTGLPQISNLWEEEESRSPNAAERQSMRQAHSDEAKTVLDLLHSLGVEDDMIMFDNFGG